MRLCLSLTSSVCTADEILGRHNPYAELYRPSRRLRALPLLPPLSFTYIKNTVAVSSAKILACPYSFTYIKNTVAVSSAMSPQQMPS